MRGDACLGAVDLTNLLTVGGLSGTDVLPTHVRITSGTRTDRTVVRAQGDITLGTDDGASLFGGDSLLRIQSTGGGINLLGGTTLAGAVNPGGVTQILGETGIDGGGATITSGGALGLYTGSGNLTLGTLRAQTLDTLNADTTVATAGSFSTNQAITINDIASISGGNLDLAGAAGVFVNQAEVSDGFDIRLVAEGGDATLNGTGTGLGTAGFITVTAGNAATLNNATAARDINLSANGLASADGLVADGSINIGGDSVSLGSARTTGATVTGDNGAVSNISVTAFGEAGSIDVTGTLDAYDRLSLDAANGPVNAAGATLTAGDDVIVRAQTLAVGTVVSRGTSAENGYGVTNDGSNITLTATGSDLTVPGGSAVPAIQIGSANANNTLTISAGQSDSEQPDASIAATSLVAGGDATATATGAITLSNGSANGAFALSSDHAGIDAGTVTAGNDPDAFGGDRRQPRLGQCRGGHHHLRRRSRQPGRRRCGK